ncbi:MAG: hypothetical protein EOO60_13370 [Hymenobacter sp.]|nr:MAG: hypothetical protein EOO60_13370 [Hymenobacter sp.]
MEHLFLYFIPLLRMKHMSTYLLVAALGLAGLSSCKKDDASTPAPTLSKTDLLTAKSWRMTDFKVAGQSVYNTPLVQACDKDDLIKFNVNKTATFDEGSVKCDPTSAQSRAGSWELMTNDTMLKLTSPDGDTMGGVIGTLSSTTLTVTDPNGFGNGNATEVTYTAQ